MADCITPLEARELRERKIIAFDTEDDSNGHVLMLDFAWRDGFGNIQHKTFTHPLFARNFINKHKGQCFFVAHNLEYDICNVYRDQEFTDIERMSYTSRLIVAEMYGMQAKFIDSFNFFSGSLAAMGEVVGIEKMEMDVNDIKYVRRDTEILLTFMEKFQKRLIHDVRVGLSPTIGGLAMKTFRTHFLPESVESWNEPKALEGYYGGRCELFYRGEVHGVYMADVNSMYPHSMLEKYPDCGTLVETKNWNDYKFGLSEVTIFIPESEYVPPLPHRDETGRLVFPVGTFRGTWTNHEIAYAVKSCKAKVLETHYSIGTDSYLEPFTEYVKHFYQMRLDAKDEHEKVMMKLLLNNLYGRLAQHNPRVEARTAEMDDEEIEETQARLIKVLGKFFIYEIPLLEPPETANWLWGSYVTSYARILLHKGLKAVEKAGAKLIYCDTDSIFWSGPKHIPGIELDEVKLGAWKIEEFAYGEFLIPKGYILKGHPIEVTEKNYKKISKKHKTVKIGDMHTEIKIACKGVPMPRAMEYEDIETESNPAWRFLKMGDSKNPKNPLMRPARLRQALAQGLVPGAWYESNKQRKTQYTRRTGAETGPTYPPVLGSATVGPR